MKNIAILGAGGHGHEVAFLIEAINFQLPTWNIIGFFDDAHEALDRDASHYPTLGSIEAAKLLPKNTSLAIGIGAGSTRRRLIEALAIPGERYPALVHPSVFTHKSIQLNNGALIFAGTTLTVNISLGRHCHINQGCTLSHGTILEDYATLSPGCHVAGDCLIEKGATLGMGVNTNQGLVIGTKTIVGSGATVVSNLPPDVIAIGTPAKAIRKG